MKRLSFRPEVDRCESRHLTTVGLSPVGHLAHPAVVPASVAQDNYYLQPEKRHGA